MQRFTSIETYSQIKEEGLLGALQFSVYHVLYNWGPLTQNELHRKHFNDTQPRNIQPRVSELEKMGVVSKVGERKCLITGRVCAIWDVTRALPSKPEKKESKDRIIKRQAQEIERLKSLLSAGQLKLL